MTKTQTSLRCLGCFLISLIFRSGFKQHRPSAVSFSWRARWKYDVKTINESGEWGRERARERKNNNWNETSQSRLTNNMSGSHLCAGTHWINVNLPIVADRHHIASKMNQKTDESRRVKMSAEQGASAERQTLTNSCELWKRCSHTPRCLRRLEEKHSRYRSLIYIYIYIPYFLRHEPRCHHILQKMALSQYLFRCARSKTCKNWDFASASPRWRLITAEQKMLRALQLTNKQHH